ncbi:hypothetical protein BP5796_07286 [Coleophoma crateriformis]|uniref:RecF/RecN/SMC N-terminal domain-containing protein n=1 Tax=Coleophoma crateriformis TaxID=565419 RepID=A0A3D8RIX5_9HELO|nr:hypothetical protein BP5796_07286 [Coleophoma crateriformis]
MAPHKRSRREVEEDEEDIVAVEGARSSLRGNDAHRRKRLSVNNPSPKSRLHTRQKSPSPASSDEDESRHQPAAENLPPATQYEILRDGGFEELMNPDLDDQRTSQRFMARRADPRQIGENHAADNAIIEEIRCLNFMCHVNMQVQLGPLINFIVGENGSGKSAILTALSLCLGGKASATKRGGSLKSFIKTGEDNATLSVKLKNQGASAYQQDLYGESIIVERHFSSTGSSGFKLKNSAGRIVSTKKSDVDDVLEYFQLQVDNPMNILTQDDAKSFITTSGPPLKYQFFYKGTQLETLDHDYQMVHESIDKSEAKIAGMEESIKDLKKRSDELRQKAAVVEEHTEMRKRIKSYRKQFAWAQVEEREVELRNCEQSVLATQESVTQAEEHTETKARELEQADAVIQRYVDLADELVRGSEPLREELDNAESALLSATQEGRDLHGQQRQIMSEISAATKRAEAFQKDIDAEKQRIAEVNGGAPAQKMAEIEIAKQSIARAQEELINSQENRRELVSALDIARNAETAAEKLVAVRKQATAEADQALNELLSNRVDPMAGFERNTARLLQLIRTDAGFREKPIGPIGQHVRLKKQHWSVVLEKAIGQTLNGFIVTSKADQMHLSKLMRSLKMNYSPILIGRKQTLDTSNTEPDPQYETVLRILDIDNELVRNQLIITQSIEQTLLVDDREEAHKIMFSGVRPRNVKSCLTLSGYNHGRGFRLSFGGRTGQDQATEPIKGNPNWKPRMQSDIEGRISYQRRVSEETHSELQKAETQRKMQQAEVRRCKIALDQHQRHHKELIVAEQKADDHHEALQVDLASINVEDGRLEALRSALKDAQDEMTLHEGSLDEAAEQLEKANEVVKERKAVVKTMKTRQADHESKLNKVSIKKKSAEQARNIVLNEKNIAIEALADARANLARYERKRKEKLELLTSYIEQANKVTPRVSIDEGMTATSLHAQLKTLSARVKEYNNQLGGSDEEILAATANAYQAWRRATESQQSLKQLNKLLKKSLFKRLIQYKAFRRYISSNARMQFNYLLSERGFRGKMTIDHRNRELDVTVEPDETRKSDKGRGTKTLSGGEKSFSSICLLLSVWEAMGAPMRCLDEFDVFMDDINRDVSTNLIINGARRSVGRQFILISPKAISGDATKGNQPDIKIHK